MQLSVSLPEEDVAVLDEYAHTIGGSGIPVKLLDAMGSRRRVVAHNSFAGSLAGYHGAYLFEDAAGLRAALQAVVLDEGRCGPATTGGDEPESPGPRTVFAGCVSR